MAQSQQTPPSPRSLLEELEARQDEVLVALEQLDARLEQVLAACQEGRGGATPAGARGAGLAPSPCAAWDALGG
jgi:hypothetical protein